MTLALFAWAAWMANVRCHEGAFVLEVLDAWR